MYPRFQPRLIALLLMAATCAVFASVTPSAPSAAAEHPVTSAPSAAEYLVTPAEATADDVRAAVSASRIAHVPMRFIENHGQFAAPVVYKADARGYAVFFTPTEIVMTLRSPGQAVLRQSFDHANPGTCVEAIDPSSERIHYLRGADAGRWRTDVTTSARVAYRELYPGIDAIWYGTERNLIEYDFIVSPGADPGVIVLRFAGTESISIDETGDLVLELGGATLRQHRPVVYQNTSSGRCAVDASYDILTHETVCFSLGAYDPSLPLVIDPTVQAATYLGGSSFERAQAIAVDGDGNIYVLGESSSIDFPTVDPLQASNAGIDDIFVTKLDPTGTTPIWSTYIGGSDSEGADDIVIDDAGRVWILGDTRSTDFPVQAAIQPTLAGNQDAVLFALDATGSSLLMSTYHGGSGFDSGAGLALDTAGDVYLSGETESTDFPLVAAMQPQLGGDTDAFVTKVSVGATPSIAYSTYIGGSDFDEADKLLVDAAGRVYVVGGTYSTDFPTASPLQASLAGGRDAFLSVLNSTGTALSYSTYFGGSDSDDADALAFDAAGNIYIYGETSSLDLPVVSAFQATNAGDEDAFIAKINPQGTVLLQSTYLGGPEADRAGDIEIHPDGSIIVSGHAGAQFPTHRPFQPFGGDIDATLTKFSPTGMSLEFSSYVGGAAEDFGSEIVLRGPDILFVGSTESIDFPTVSPFQATPGGEQDAFLIVVRDSRVHVSPGDSLLLDSQDLTLAFIVEAAPDATWNRITFNGIDRTQFLLDRGTVGSLGGASPGITLQLPVRVQQIINKLGNGPIVVTAEAGTGTSTIATTVTWRLLPNITP